MKPCYVGSFITLVSSGIRAKVFLFVFLFLKPFFALFSSFFEGFCITKEIICKLGVLSFWLFNSRDFYFSILGLYLSCADMNRIIAFLSLVINFLNIKSSLEICFGLSLDRFQDHLFSHIQFSNFLFNIDFYKEIKAFSKKSNKVGLF